MSISMARTTCLAPRLAFHLAPRFGGRMPTRRPAALLVALIGLLGVALSVRGALIQVDLDRLGQVEFHGLGRATFEWLICGSLLTVAAGVVRLQDAACCHAARRARGRR